MRSKALFREAHKAGSGVSWELIVFSGQVLLIRRLASLKDVKMFFCLSSGVARLTKKGRARRAFSLSQIGFLSQDGRGPRISSHIYMRSHSTHV